jgi:hypothetical protein
MSSIYRSQKAMAMRDPNGGPQGYGDIWRAVVLLSLCGFFEIYEIALTSAFSG